LHHEKLSTNQEESPTLTKKKKETKPNESPGLKKKEVSNPNESEVTASRKTGSDELQKQKTQEIIRRRTEEILDLTEGSSQFSIRQNRVAQRHSPQIKKSRQL
jgi:cell division ATPase FtsA